MLQRINSLNNWRSLLALVALLLAVGVISAQPSFGRPLAADETGTASNSQAPGPHGAASDLSVGQAARFHASQPLRSIQPQPPVYNPNQQEGPENPMPDDSFANRWIRDTVVQRTFGPLGGSTMPTPIANFDGMYNHWGPIPPDTNGEIGPNHYVQIVNNGFQIYSKTGQSLYGPVDTSILFRGLGGPCETRNDGDPIVLYDQLADRWNISQFTSAAPYHQCIAISQSGDPLGAWYQYAFLESNTVFDDYPHLGVWPDGYYMTTNRFINGATFGGGGNYVFERPKMLTGDPTARFIRFITSGGGALPSDLDGPTPPPAGSPNYFLFPTSASSGTISEYKFHVDWTNTLSSTFTGPTTITVAPWNNTICDTTRGQCIDQPSTTTKLESLAGRFMFRLAYRNMGTHESLVANHTVNATGANPGVAGIRWYEIRDPDGTLGPTIYQQGTYQPDSTHRFMGSIAMDRSGNIALGYSASSSVISPSLRYAGRVVSDTLGTLPQGEVVLYQGQGVEDFPGTGRWGDYSDMTVDPSDDCTFWYTNEYFQRQGNRNWRTRIGSFKFPGCASAITPTPIPPTATPTTCTINFSDVPTTHTFYEFVRCLYCRGAITGYNDGTFRPNEPTTRGQVTKMVIIAFNIPINLANAPHFSDVPASYVFYPYIETAYNNGLISGYAGGTFRPGEEVSRGQLTKIIVQAAALKLGWVILNPSTPRFNDVPASDVFYTFIETAVCHGIISGYSDGSFKPGDNATRGQIAKLVCLAMRNQTPCGTPDCVTAFTRTGSLTSGDPVQIGRLSASSPSTCELPRACPGIYGLESLPRHYDVYTYTNTLATAQCVTVSINEACGDNHLRSTTYLNTFNPNSICANYLADHGGVGGQNFSYSFTLEAGQTAHVVVYEGTSNLSCDSYTISVAPCVGRPTYTPTVTRSPTITTTPYPTCGPGSEYIVDVSTGATIDPGTDLVPGSQCDDCIVPLTLPFAFNIYGMPRTTVNLSSNGNMQFFSANGSGASVCLPTSTVNYAIMGYWDDLDLSAEVDPTYGIYTTTSGTVGSRTFMIEWRGVIFDTNLRVNFEIRMFEGQDNFDIRYGILDNTGTDATVGVQRATGISFTRYSCDTGSLLQPGMLLAFRALGCGEPTRTPTVTNTPTVGVTNTPTNTATATNTPVPPVAVSIVDYAFEPMTTTVTAGMTVRWTNNGPNQPHNSVSTQGLWNSGTLNVTQSYERSFSSAGTYPYICTIHPSMVGSIVVTPPLRTKDE